MSEEKKYQAFKVAGYECEIEFIRAEPEDRYGWKKDHLLVWIKIYSRSGQCDIHRGGNTHQKI